MRQADAIRAHVLERYVEPARRRGDKIVKVKAFAALGGGENWLRRERASFYDAAAGAVAPGKGRTA